MLVTLTQFRDLARDQNGNVLPMGKDKLAAESRTAAGSFAPLQDDCSFVRLATDTAILIDGSLYVANSVEYLAVNGGEALAIALPT